MGQGWDFSSENKYKSKQTKCGTSYEGSGAECSGMHVVILILSFSMILMITSSMFSSPPYRDNHHILNIIVKNKLTFLDSLVVVILYCQLRISRVI